MRPLFASYPGLTGNLPHVELGALPTPVQRMERLERTLDIGAGRLYVKRDDLTSGLYGGNKVRKLEFLLAQALHDGRRAVMTFGAAGSNHALATALFARRMGMHSISMLMGQPNAEYVRRNLLMSRGAGAELHYAENMPRVTLASLKQVCAHAMRDGGFPFLIAPGGSSPRGMVGFVNAALELKAQIDEGLLPEPDCVYAASGTMGTTIGLLLGLTVAGLKTRVVAVRVTDPQFTSLRKARRCFANTCRLLRQADPQFPMPAFPEDKLDLRHDFFGEGYALYTEAGVRAVRRAAETEGLKLEGTYTGKTLAALLADAESGVLKDKTVLFWDTCNSRDFTQEVAGVDYHDLPAAFHRFFENDVQPLDRAE